MRAVVAVAAAVALVPLSCGGRPSSPPPKPVAKPAAPAPVSPPAPPAAPAALTDPGLRLPRDVDIQSYALQLDIDPAQSTMHGVVAISGAVARETSTVWLHAENLTIREAIAKVGGKDVALKPDTTVAPGKLALQSFRPLPPGPITIVIRYDAPLAETETAGTFRQPVGDDWYVFTQHEAISARRSVPCLDEPDSKVPWRVEIKAPSPLVVVANAPAERDVPDGAFHTVTFAPTEPLPPYLIAYAVGPFDIVDAGKSAGGTPHRILTLKGRAAEARYAAALMPKITTELEKWFGMPHPFPKLDSITIPATVGFGAMENPGLITYKESLLLLPEDATPVRRSRLLGLAAHEIAHQWFGNLVTPVYWDDIWLNESFASWLPEKIVTAIEPTWRLPVDATDGREDALSSDGLASARRIRQPIAGEGDIVTAFDRITYAKGSTVLRLFEQRVGAERFQAGVRAYMTKFARKNATAADFLAAIDEAAPDSGAGAAMATFLDQAGAPRLTAAIECPKGGQAGVRLAQSRFLPPGAGTAAAQTWTLPVCLSAGTQKAEQQACVTMTQAETFVPLAECPTWVWPNSGGVGYWRTSMDVAGWGALRTAGWKYLDAAERVSAAHDLFAATGAGELDVAVALDLVPVLVAENNRQAIGAAVGLIERVDPWVPAADRPKFEAWVRKQLGKKANALGWLPKKGDDIQKDAMRGRVVSVTATIGADPALRKAAVKLARDWRKLPEAARGDVLSAAVRADPKLVDTLIADFVAETSRSKRADLARALAWPGDPQKLAPALALTIDPAIDIRDSLAILQGAVAHDEQRAIAMAFALEHFDALVARLPGEYATGLVGVLAAGCDAEAVARKDVAEQRLGQLRGARRRIDQAWERIDQCIARKAAVEPALATWLTRVRS
ncbi:MAG TPA: M1 family aminopeptidase [Kofleriaceae bacterium]|nr:M1 family aminopeptidase [Kofleriaceae bacterium]